MAKTNHTSPSHRRGGADLWLLANHDFRQPGQTLAFLAEQLMTSKSKPERQELGASIALMGVALDAMVDGMTLVARLEAELQHAITSRTTLGAVIGPVVDELGSIVTTQGRRLDVSGLDFAIEADADLLRALAKGLLIYAIKFSDGGDIFVKGRTRRAAIAFDICYAGPDPDRALREKAFVELPPSPRAPGVAIIGFGPALGARLAAHTGLILEPGIECDGRRRLTVLIPKPKRQNQG